MCIELFHIGKVTVYGYGLMIALGVISAFALACGRAKKFYTISPDTIFNAGFIGVICGLLGGKITYWIVEIRSIIEDPRLMITDIGGGFVVYGGLLLGLLAPAIYLYIKKEKVLQVLDLIMPSISLGQGLGRIGCFLAGCCYGNATDAWYGVVFPENSMAPAGVALIPTQLISSGLDILLCVILLMMTRRQRFRGSIVAAYTVLYGVGRFFVEMLRNDPRGTIGIFSTSQFIAIFAVVGGLAFFFILMSQKLAPLSEALRPEFKKAFGYVNDGEEDGEAEEAEETEEAEEKEESETAEEVSEAAEEVQEAAEAVKETAEDIAAVEEAAEAAEKVAETSEAADGTADQTED